MIMNLNGENVEIDNLCVPFIDFFNRKGITTKYCCEGHTKTESFMIVFDESVTDEMFMEFYKKYWYAFEEVCPFHKWTRISVKDGLEFQTIEDYDKVLTQSYNSDCHDLMTNWVMEITPNMFDTDKNEKLTKLNTILDRLISIENRTTE